MNHFHLIGFGQCFNTATEKQTVYSLNNNNINNSSSNNDNKGFCNQVLQHKETNDSVHTKHLNENLAT